MAKPLLRRRKEVEMELLYVGLGGALGILFMIGWLSCRAAKLSDNCLECPMYKQVVVMELRQGRY